MNDHLLKPIIKVRQHRNAGGVRSGRAGRGFGAAREHAAIQVRNEIEEQIELTSGGGRILSARAAAKFDDVVNQRMEEQIDRIVPARFVMHMKRDGRCECLQRHALQQRHQRHPIIPEWHAHAERAVGEVLERGARKEEIIVAQRVCLAARGLISSEVRGVRHIHARPTQQAAVRFAPDEVAKPRHVPQIDVRVDDAHDARRRCKAARRDRLAQHFQHVVDERHRLFGETLGRRAHRQHHHVGKGFAHGIGFRRAVDRNHFEPAGDPRGDRCGLKRQIARGHEARGKENGRGGHAVQGR